MIYTIRMELQNESFRRYSRWNQQWYGLFFRVAFKPVATIMQKQESLDNQHYGNDRKGRHDPCGPASSAYRWNGCDCIS
jgi:hypothetical protein